MTIVCVTPRESIWLLLASNAHNSELSSTLGTSTWLNLETGEVFEMRRPLCELLKFGWKVAFS